jgi:apolipoprotein N-acyltransferase
VIVFAGLLALLEWLRGHIFTGFPWDLPGETWRAGSPVSQGAALVGAYGLTWITLVIASAPAVIVEGWRGRTAVVGAVVALAGLYGFGAMRLAGAPPSDPRAPILRVVQADVRQESKYDPALFNSIVTRYLALTARAAPRRPDIVIWPEGAIPAAMEDYLAPGTWTRAAMVAALQPGQTLILGGYRVANATVTPPVVFNSLAALRRDGDQLAVVGVYDKFRLVPFGEFLPFDALAGRLGIKTFVHVGDGFTAGPRPRPLKLPGLPTTQPLICYEALYPGFTREGAAAAGARPAWIVNISNDAWFGATSGPLQHLNIASYRAIEEGLPMVRSTPTGVSAVIDAFGRPLASLGEGAYGIIDRPLPPALAPTPFSRWGDLPFAIMLLASLARGRWRRRPG